MIPGNANPLLLATAAADAAAAGPIKSLRFNDGDSASLSKTFSSAGNRKTFTFSAWVKRCTFGAYQTIISAGNSSPSQRGGIRFRDDDKLEVTEDSLGFDLRTTRLFRDPSAWYHIVAAVDTTQGTASNRIKLYVNGVEEDAFDSSSYPSQNFDCILNSGDPHRIGELSYAGNIYELDGYLADIYFIDGSQLDATSFGAFDDNGVWQAAEYSGTFGTNGFHLLDFANESTVGHDSSGNDNDFTANNIGTGGNGDYISELNNVNDFYGNGRATWGPTLFNGATGDKGPVPAAGTPMTYTPSSSITLTGTGLRIWVSRNKGGLFINGNSVSSTEQQWNSFGTTYSPLTSIEWRTTDGSNFSQLSAIEINGTQLIDNTAVGAGNDILFDVPTNGSQSDGGNGGEVSGNYCTFNPLLSNGTLSNGNLDVTTNLTGDSHTHGTIAFPSSGKWYYEITPTASGNQAYIYIGDGAANVANSVLYYGNDGKKRVDGTFSTYGATYGNNDVIGVAVNVDDGEVTFYKNGSSQGAISYTISGKTLFPAVADGSSGAAVSFSANWGQRAFAYSAPSGYKALNTASMSAATIADGSDYFDTKLWTGTGSARSITGYEFSPDWVWIKQRSSSYHHVVFDSVRGVNNRLNTNLTNAEDTGAGVGVVSAFNSDGFSLDGGGGNVNQSSATYVGWAWDAGSSTASNTDGNITANVRANTTAGFSIVTWTAAAPGTSTIGHGLSDVPAFVITKSRTTANHWAIFHKDLGQGKLLRFNTSGSLSVSNYWGSSSNWTSSTFCVTATTTADNNIGNMVAYCFAPVAGYSAFGSYTGNGSSDGNFIYTGFRPAWIVIKCTSSQNWILHDTKRDPHNVVTNQLYPSSSGAEADFSGNAKDILSNGFKLRGTNSGTNDSNGTTEYIWAAFAENPFQANGGLAR